MRPRISIRGSVRSSVRPWVRNAFSQTPARCILRLKSFIPDRKCLTSIFPINFAFHFVDTLTTKTWFPNKGVWMPAIDVINDARVDACFLHRYVFSCDPKT